MTRSSLRFSSLVLVSIAACGTPAAPAVHPVAEPALASPEPPRLAVVVVLDQLGSATLSRYLPHLPEDGLLRRLAREGVYHERVAYAYAATQTAAGHASIHTGVSPSVHGVMGNERWDARRGEVAWVDDSEHAVLGVDDEFAAPTMVRAPTVADALREAHGERARVVSLSYKDRGAVIPGGQHPLMAIFWDKAHARFTTSTYYAEERPAWLVAFESAHPAPLAPWTPEDPAALEALLGPDDRPGEGAWQGMDATFPHDPNEAPVPGSAFRATPQASEHLVEMALAAVDAYELGRDEVPDLLALSFSGTDYVGHAFGPASWEYLDNLRRVDRALMHLVRELEARTDGSLAILVTSDHGHMRMPEALRAEGIDAGRLLPASLVAAAEAAIDAALGPGDWVDAFAHPLLYLSDAVGEAQLDRAIEAARRGLAEVDGVYGAYDARDREALARSGDPVERAMAESLGDDPPGLVAVATREHWFVDDEAPQDHGTGHGGPWPHDQEVPVLFTGPGLGPMQGRELLPQARVAPTIAALLRIAPPARAEAPALPGTPQ